MSRQCSICGKGTQRGNKVSHSKIKTKRTWYPNLQSVNAVVAGKRKRIRGCTGCLKANKGTKSA